MPSGESFPPPAPPPPAPGLHPGVQPGPSLHAAVARPRPHSYLSTSGLRQVERQGLPLETEALCLQGGPWCPPPWVSVPRATNWPLLCELSRVQPHPPAQSLDPGDPRGWTGPVPSAHPRPQLRALCLRQGRAPIWGTGAQPRGDSLHPREGSHLSFPSSSSSALCQPQRFRALSPDPDGSALASAGPSKALTVQSPSAAPWPQ